MKILSRENEIVWVNYHGSRRPGLNARDAGACWTAIRRVVSGLSRVSPSFVQVTPMVIPGAESRLSRWLRARMLIAQIRRAVRAVQGPKPRPVQIWSFAPDVPYLIGRFGEERFVYYCVDQYAEFEDFDRERIVAAENELVDRADTVVVTSEPLRCAKRQRRPDVHLVRHGVAHDHFASAWRDRPSCPADVADIQRPIFGFFGLIQHWIDTALLTEVARLRPGYSFVLIGDCKVDVAALRALPNVHLLGRRSYQSLPAYCAAFEAALLPFVQSPMTRYVNPIKMLEYLAAGLPIISTPLPEAERFPAAIRIANSAKGFASACDQVLETASAERRQQISGLVVDESWDAVVDRLSEIVLDQTPQTTTHAPHPQTPPPVAATAAPPEPARAV